MMPLGSYFRGLGLAAIALVAAAGPALAEGGLPQLNPAGFAPQVIWLAISFAALYFLMSKVALPGISATLAARHQKLDGDLAAAEKFKADAEGAIATYKKTMAEARAKAQAEIKEAAAGVLAEAGKREAAFAAEVNARTKTAEQAIATAKTKALGDIRTMAGDATRELVARLSGAEPAAGEIAAAIEAAEREQR